MKDKKIYIVGVLGAAFFLYTYFSYIFFPLQKELTTKKKRIKETIENTKKAKSQVGKLEIIKKEISDLEAEIKALEKKLQKTPDIPSTIKIITKNMRKFNLNIQSISPATPQTGPNYDQLPFTLTYQGNYHTLALFLSEMCQEEKIFSVNNLNMNSTGGGDKKRTISGNFTLVSYVFKK